MGAFERQTDLGDNNVIDSNRVPIVAGLMALLALFAPVATSGSSYGYSFYLMITAMTWSVYIDGVSPIRFEFLPSYALLGMIPFLMFRAGSMYLITRYYQGKTTKGRARIAAFIGDAPFIIVYSFLITFGGFSGGIGLNFPLPIMMFVGLLLLWRFPVPDVVVPWEGADEPTPWWEEKPQEKTEPPADDPPW